jgi:hypothetical protein
MVLVVDKLVGLFICKQTVFGGCTCANFSHLFWRRRGTLPASAAEVAARNLSVGIPKLISYPEIRLVLESWPRRGAYFFREVGWDFIPFDFFDFYRFTRLEQLYFTKYPTLPPNPEHSYCPCNNAAPNLSYVQGSRKNATYD